MARQESVKAGRQAPMVRGVSNVDPAEVQRLLPAGLDTFDHLATMVMVVEPDGQCLFVNAAFEEVLGLSRRSVLRESIFDWFTDPALLLAHSFVCLVRNDMNPTSRIPGLLNRPGYLL